jgi:hypothetical protein
MKERHLRRAGWTTESGFEGESGHQKTDPLPGRSPSVPSEGSLRALVTLSARGVSDLSRLHRLNCACQSRRPKRARHGPPQHLHQRLR